MKKIPITPASYAKYILGDETRRYCNKCGKIFDVVESAINKLFDDGGRVLSPCCKNAFNNEVLCKQYGKCEFNNIYQDCGSNCTKYEY
jgi:hypothetical protein